MHETPQEKLKRRLREQLNKQSFAPPPRPLFVNAGLTRFVVPGSVDREKDVTERKAEEVAEERRKRDELLAQSRRYGTTGVSCTVLVVLISTGATQECLTFAPVASLRLARFALALALPAHGGARASTIPESAAVSSPPVPPLTVAPPARRRTPPCSQLIGVVSLPVTFVALAVTAAQASAALAVARSASLASTTATRLVVGSVSSAVRLVLSPIHGGAHCVSDLCVPCTARAAPRAEGDEIER